MDGDLFVWKCPDCAESMRSESATSVRCSTCQISVPRESGIWNAAPGFSPSGFSSKRREHLHEIENDHFWFPPRQSLLESKLTELIAGTAGDFIELGCGSGRFLSSLSLKAARGTRRAGVEGHLASLERAHERSADPTWIHADLTRTPLADGQFDAVGAFDVLEHVAPKPLLSEAFRLARPGGALLVSVPAFPSLWSPHDDAAGHRLRYRRAQLESELAAAGWRIEGHTHYQCVLFPLVWLSRSRALRSLSGQRQTPRLERQPPAWLGRLLRFVNQTEVTMLKRTTLPFGSSLVAWARKPQ